MTRRTREEITESVNTIRRNTDAFVSHPDGEEELRGQKTALANLLVLLKENQTVTGGNYYDHMQKSLEQADEYCNRLVNNDVTADRETFYAVLSYLKEQADSYLNHKKAMERAGYPDTSDIGKKRIASAKLVSEMIKKSADALGRSLNYGRSAVFAGPADENGKRYPGRNQFNAQGELLEELQRMLKDTTGIIHGESDAFKQMMKQLNETITASLNLRNNPDMLEARSAYASMMADLAKDTEAYLKYKRDNNDFKDTSTKRIQLAGRLDLLLKGAVKPLKEGVAAALNKELNDYRVDEMNRARSWFHDLLGELEKKGVHPDNPVTASGVIAISADGPGTAEAMAMLNRIGDVSAEQSAQDLKKILDKRYMAFARMKADGTPEHPYDGRENAADWMMREMPAREEDFTAEHILNLYRLAKQNRLFLNSNKDATQDSETFERITVSADGLCMIDAPAAGIDSDTKEYRNENDYKKFGISKVQLKKLMDDLSVANRLIFANNQAEYLRASLENNEELSEEQKAEVLSVSRNMYTDRDMRVITQHYPEWFKNAEDAHHLAELCRIEGIPEDMRNNADQAMLNEGNTVWTYQVLKLSDRFLKAAGVRNYDELLMKEAGKEDGTLYEAETGYRLANQVFYDLTHNKKVFIGNRQFELKEGNIAASYRPLPDETADEYMQCMEKCLKEMKNLFAEDVPEEELAEWGADYGANDEEGMSVYRSALSELIVSTRMKMNVLENMKEEAESQERELHYADFLNMDGGKLKSHVETYMKEFGRNDAFEENDFRMVRLCNQYLDLFDDMTSNLNHPSAEDYNLQKRLAEHLITLKAEKTLMNAEALPEQHAAAVNVLTDRRFRAKAVRKAEKDPFVQRLMKEDKGVQALKLSDDKFLAAHDQQLKNRNNAVKAAVEKKDVPEAKDRSYAVHNPF